MYKSTVTIDILPQGHKIISCQHYIHWKLPAEWSSLQPLQRSRLSFRRLSHSNALYSGLGLFFEGCCAVDHPDLEEKLYIESSKKLPDFLPSFSIRTSPGKASYSYSLSYYMSETWASSSPLLQSYLLPMVLHPLARLSDPPPSECDRLPPNSVTERGCNMDLASSLSQVFREPRSTVCNSSIRRR